MHTKFSTGSSSMHAAAAMSSSIMHACQLIVIHAGPCMPVHSCASC
jgi:hypothetical protein